MLMSRSIKFQSEDVIYRISTRFKYPALGIFQLNFAVENSVNTRNNQVTNNEVSLKYLDTDSFIQMHFVSH